TRERCTPWTAPCARLPISSAESCRSTTSEAARSVPRNAGRSSAVRGRCSRSPSSAFALLGRARAGVPKANSLRVGRGQRRRLALERVARALLGRNLDHADRVEREDHVVRRVDLPPARCKARAHRELVVVVLEQLTQSHEI